MKSFIASLHAALFAILLAVSPAGSGSMLLLGAGKPTGGAVIPLSLDGTPQTANATTAGLLLPAFTTFNSNNVICVAVTTNGAPVTSVTGGGLAFAREPGLTPPFTGASQLELWYAIALGPLANVQFTINVTTSAFTTGLVFAVTGAKTSAPFDVSGPTTSSASAPNAKLTTTANNTFGIGMGVGSASTPAAGWANMSATATSNFLIVDWNIFSSPQANTTFDTTAMSAAIATAIVQGP